MSSQNVDERVVQMEFDNRQFEAGAKETMSTLEKLKQSLKLDESAKGFSQIDKAAKSMDLSSIGANLEALNDRFSTFGIVGMTVIQRLTNAAIDLGNKLANMVSKPLNQIKTGGWNRALNIENAMFKMAGLLNDEFEGLRSTIDANIDYAVSGTAYSYDAAASAMAQLMASGVEFRGEAEDMKKALRGISGVAAMTNSSYEEIAHIFTTVAGNGRLMTEQLNMIAGRGINAAAELAKYFHITEEELRAMVSKGDVHFAEFADAMDTAFGEHAKKANETWTGALSNIKAALSRTGQGFGASLQHWGRDILNAIRPNINNFNKKYLQPFVNMFDVSLEYIATKVKSIFGDGNEGILYLGWVPRVFRTLENVALGLVGIFEQIKKAFREIFPEKTRYDFLMFWVRIERATNKFRRAFSDATSFVDLFRQKIDEFTQPAQDAAAAVEKVAHTAEELEEITKRVIRGDFGNGQKRFEALEELGWNWKEVQNRVNETLGCSFRYEITQEDILTTAEAISEEEKKLGVFADKWGNYTKIASEEHKKALKTEKKLSAEERARSLRLSNIQDTFKGIASALKIVGLAVEAVKKVIINPFMEKTLPALLDRFLMLTAKIGRKVTALADKLEETKWFESFFEGVVKVTKDIFTFLGFIVGKLKEFVGWFLQLQPVQDILNIIKNFFSDLSGNVDKSKNRVKEFGKTISNLPGVQKLATALAGIAIAIKNIFESKLGQLSDWLKGLNLSGEAAMLPGGFLWVIDKAAGLLGTLIENLGKGAGAVGTFISTFSKSAYESVTEFFQGALDALKPGNIQKKLEENGGIKGIILGFFGSIGKAIQDAFGAIEWPDFGKLLIKGIGLGFVFLFASLLTTLGDVFVNLSNMTRAAASVMWNINKGIIAFTASLKADVILKIAEAVGVFTLCLVALALLPSDKLITVGAVIIVLTFAIKKMIDALMGFGFGSDLRAITKVADIIKLSLGRLAELGGIALIVISVTAGLYIAFRAFKETLDLVSGPNADKMLNAALTLIAIFGSLVVAVGVMLLILKSLRESQTTASGVDMIGLATMFIAVGGALYLIAAAVKKFDSINWKGLAIVGVALAALVVAIGILAKSVKGGRKILNAAALVVSISIALSALVIPLAIISNIANDSTKYKGLITAAVILGVFLLALSALAAAVSLIKASTILALTAGLVVFIGAMYAVLNLISLIGSMPLDSGAVKKTLIIAGILTAAVAALAIAGAFLGQGRWKGVASLASAFISIGVGCLAFAAAALVLGAALPMLANGLADFGKILVDRAPEITAGVIAIAGAVLAGVIASKALMAKASSAGIGAFIAGLSTSWPEILDFIGTKGFMTIAVLVGVLLVAAEKLVPDFVDGLIRIINVLADTLHSRAPEIAEAFDKVLFAVAEIISMAVWKIIDATFGRLIEGISNSIADAIDKLPPQVKEFLHGKWGIDADTFRFSTEGLETLMTQGFNNMYNDLEWGAEQGGKRIGEAQAKGYGIGVGQVALRQEEAAESTLTLYEETNDQIVSETEETVGEINGATSGISGFFSKYISSDMLKSIGLMNEDGTILAGLSAMTGAEVSENFGDNINLSSILGADMAEAIRNGEIDGNTLNNVLSGNFQNSGVPEAADNMATETNANLSKIGEDDNFETGYDRVEDVANGMNEALPLVQEAATNVTSTLLETAATATKEMGTQGAAGGTAYGKGIRSKVTPTYYSAYALKSSAQNGVAGSYKAGYTPGSQFGEGFFDGISSWANAIADKAYKIVKDAVDSAKEAEKSNSPSKETMKLGNYFGEGFVIGITQMSGAVERTASDMATSALDTMRDAISMAAQVLEDEGAYEPTIRPVIDLSGVHEGAAQINSTLASFKPSTAVKAAANISGTLADRFGAETLQNGVAGSVTNNFTQNNYSPRYLSRLDIYRQTKNMFALAKG